VTKVTRQSLNEQIRQRVKEKVEGEHPNFWFHYDNMPFELPDGTSSYIRVIIVPDRRQQRSFGGNKHRYRTHGTLLLSVFTQFEQGDASAMLLADEVMPHFQNITEGDISWQTPEPKRVGRAGKWFLVNIVCPFYSDSLE